MAKQKTVTVGLVGSRNQGFNRALRDKNGDIVRLMRFEPGQPLELNAAEYEAVKGDIGNTLVVVGEAVVTEPEEQTVSKSTGGSRGRGKAKVVEPDAE